MSTHSWSTCHGKPGSRPTFRLKWREVHHPWQMLLKQHSYYGYGWLYSITNNFFASWSTRTCVLQSQGLPPSSRKKKECRLSVEEEPCRGGVDQLVSLCCKKTVHTWTLLHDKYLMWMVQPMHWRTTLFSTAGTFGLNKNSLSPLLSKNAWQRYNEFSLIKMSVFLNSHLSDRNWLKILSNEKRLIIAWQV